VHEPELGVDQVEVEVEALATTADDLGMPEGAAELALEREARFESGEDADEAASDVVAFGDCDSLLRLGIAGGTCTCVLKVLVGAALRCGESLTGIDDFAALSEHVVLEVLREDVYAIEVALDGAVREEGGQVTAEDESIEGRQPPDDTLLKYRAGGDHGREWQLGRCGVQYPDRRASS
jgi:hypothetical protein